MPAPFQMHSSLDYPHNLLIRNRPVHLAVSQNLTLEHKVDENLDREPVYGPLPAHFQRQSFELCTE